jgi:hypothetical protein
LLLDGSLSMRYPVFSLTKLRDAPDGPSSPGTWRREE